ncbi:MAG: sulfatase-like hydrolase/transferase [Vicinamibacteria bacterium]
MRRSSFKLGLALFAALGCACRESSSPRSKGASVILITIDTLRADRLGAYGSKAGLTPGLDALASQSVVFEEAYSHVPLTLPAHTSLFTSLLPPRHGVRDNLGYTLGEHRTVAETFKAHGYMTLGAVSSFVLRKGTGIARGFDKYDDDIPTRTDAALGHQQREGARTAQLLADLISASPGPIFAFLHIYEPHTPYEPPARHRGHASPYDGEVAWADEIVTGFMDKLRDLGRFDNAIVAVTADHGEGLGDHGEEEHGVLLYREALHVPMLIRLPGAALVRRIPTTVRQVDLAQTLLDLAGLPAMPETDGETLVPLMLGPGPNRVSYAESFYGRLHMGWSEIFAVTEGKDRYIQAPRPEFFDIVADPLEKNNLFAARGPLAARMDGWVREQSSKSVFTQPGEVDAQTREKLRSLGYLGGSAAVAPSSPGERLPDPKDQIGSWAVFEKGLSLRQAGRLDEAIRVFEGVLRENPGMSDGWETLAQTLFLAGRPQEARRAFDRVIAFDPARSSAHLSIAKLERLAGHADKAREHANIAAERDPGGAYEFVAELELSQGRLAEAATAAQRSLDADPSRPMSHYTLGLAAMRRGDMKEAEARFRSAMERSASDTGRIFANLHASLADCLARMGRETEAEAEFRKEIEIVPASRPGRVGLAMLLRSQGRDADARASIEGLAEQAGAGPEDFEVVIRTLLALGDGEAANRWRSRARAQFPRDPRFR